MTATLRCDNPDAEAIPAAIVEATLDGIEAQLVLLERRVTPTVNAATLAFQAGVTDGGIRRWIELLRRALHDDLTSAACQFETDDPDDVEIDRHREVWTCPDCGQVHDL